jgi:hypothetical protein
MSHHPYCSSEAGLTQPCTVRCRAQPDNQGRVRLKAGEVQGNYKLDLMCYICPMLLFNFLEFSNTIYHVWP